MNFFLYISIQRARIYVFTNGFSRKKEINIYVERSVTRTCVFIKITYEDNKSIFCSLSALSIQQLSNAMLGE